MKHSTYKISMLIMVVICFSTQETYSQWIANYSNNGSGSFGGWSINSTDKYTVNNFTSGGSNNNNLLCVNGAFATLLFRASNNWNTDWSNGGNGKIEGWNISANDKYTAFGNESVQGYFLSVNPANGWAAIFRFEVNQYQQFYPTAKWTNSGNNAINGWNMHPVDQYVSGNFVAASSPEHEVLFISPQSGHVATQRYTGSGWSALNWTTNGKIGNVWSLNTNDKYIAGDFDNDGTDELLCTNSNGWAMLLEYNGSSWQSVWSNGGNFYIGGYHIGSADVYLRGKITESDQTQLFVINPSIDNSALMYFSAGSWTTIVTNSDWLGSWNIASNDKYATLGFGSHHKLFTSNSNGWSNLMQYDISPSTPQNLSVVSYSSGGQNYPKLTWTQNIEWDVKDNSQGYQIWRRIHNGVTWHAYSQIGTVSGITTTYVDYGTPGVGPGGPETAEYKVRAADLATNLSNYSSPQSINFGIYIDHKQIKIVKSAPENYYVGSNYPNPFNPSTSLEYGLPVKSEVGIIIFNSLGQMVLHNEPVEKEKGWHIFNFNANNLASGVYYCQIVVSPIENEKKFQL